jgi:hypothetical protein
MATRSASTPTGSRSASCLRPSSTPAAGRSAPAHPRLNRQAGETRVVYQYLRCSEHRADRRDTAGCHDRRWRGEPRRARERLFEPGPCLRSSQPRVPLYNLYRATPPLFGDEDHVLAAIAGEQSNRFFIETRSLAVSLRGDRSRLRCKFRDTSFHQPQESLMIAGPGNQTSFEISDSYPSAASAGSTPCLRPVSTQ